MHAEAADSESRTVNFLLIEDDVDHAALIRRSLSRTSISHVVHHVRNGADGLGFLRQEGAFADQKRPDVVILDLNLPKLNGHEVLEAKRNDETLASIPVVVLTTSNAAQDRASAYRFGANSYLVKPLEFVQFREMVDDLSRYWGIWNQPAPLEDR